jgi:hypothetical protein
MTEATPFPPGLSPVGGKTIGATFDGGKLLSNRGVLILRERKLGFAAVLSRHIPAIATARGSRTATATRRARGCSRLQRP